MPSPCKMMYFTEFSLRSMVQIASSKFNVEPATQNSERVPAAIPRSETRRDLLRYNLDCGWNPEPCAFGAASFVPRSSQTATLPAVFSSEESPRPTREAHLRHVATAKSPRYSRRSGRRFGRYRRRCRHDLWRQTERKMAWRFVPAAEALARRSEP